MNKQPLWQPIVGEGGFSTGIYLDSSFARSCDQILLTENGARSSFLSE